MIARVISKGLRSTGTRGFSFFYPRRFGGVSTVEKYTPQKDEYLRSQHAFKPGDTAPLAYPNIRHYPQWYKPASFNSHGYGHQAFLMAMLVGANAVVVYEYNLKKGRRKAKRVYNPFGRESAGQGVLFAKERIEAKDPEWTKFLQLPPE
eukprot:TRINITY_DN8678_c0_g1_i4.p2 TRINITY_DN8678_c0_g1~~TRINITY_DN8678_c0_g1_i4.p2  ORF type:complete len:149 (+),score=41.55 TRINITY_DN8678_c0_g1_i4:168-614(+)